MPERQQPARTTQHQATATSAWTRSSEIACGLKSLESLHAPSIRTTRTAPEALHEYAAQTERWQFNIYNRLSFWLKCPPNASPLMSSGQENLQVGTYVKRVKDADRHSDEVGGDHGYHLFNVARPAPGPGWW